MVASAASSDRHPEHTPQHPTSPSAGHLHLDSLPLCQLHPSVHSDDASIASEFSILSTDSLLSNTPTSLLEPETVIVPTARNRSADSPSTLLAEWKSLFRRLLVADDHGRPTNHHANETTAAKPTNLPPPIRTAPNEPYGDDFDKKEAGAFRVWSVKASEISTREGHADLHSLCISVCTRSVEAATIQETNTDFMQPDIREKYTAIFKEHFGQARVITATTCIHAPSTWKPGGVLLAILGPWAQHVSKVTRDDLGRWASATLTWSNGESFTLFSVYNVVNTPLSAAGPSTVYFQQYRLLRLSGVKIPNPRKQFVTDLHSAAAGLIANNKTVTILGDFNETLGANPRMMSSLCASHNRFEVLALFHGQAVQIPMYARGTKRLDNCLSSTSLEGLVAACCYNLFNEYIHSDHRAIFINICLKELLGQGTPKLASPNL
jgi:hypothetical protein